MRIAVVNSKGGVGKTTTSVYLAAAASARGLTVELVDMDRQQSLTTWLDEASPLPYGVTYRRANANSAGRASSAAVTILDAPPGDPKDIDAASEIADFIVIPTLPGLLNDERTIATWKYLNQFRWPAWVLLVGIDPRRVVARQTRQRIADSGADIDLLTSWIPNRTDVVGAAGTWPKELHGYDAVLSEIMQKVESNQTEAHALTYSTAEKPVSRLFRRRV